MCCFVGCVSTKMIKLMSLDFIQKLFKQKRQHLKKRDFQRGALIDSVRLRVLQTNMEGLANGKPASRLFISFCVATAAAAFDRDAIIDVVRHNFGCGIMKHVSLGAMLLKPIGHLHANARPCLQFGDALQVFDALSAVKAALSCVWAAKDKSLIHNVLQ